VRIPQKADTCVKKKGEGARTKERMSRSTQDLQSPRQLTERFEESHQGGSKGGVRIRPRRCLADRHWSIPGSLGERGFPDMRKERRGTKETPL